MHVAPGRAMTLDGESLSRSLRHLGSDQSFTDRLISGKPVSVAILGASVAQFGGCASQPGARCMQHSTKSNEGYFIRFFNELNASFPNLGHTFYNGARDATPPEQFNYCMMSSLPTSLPHLIILEFGSMARHVKLARTELLIRRLLQLPSRPALLFVTMREWCAAAHLGFGHAVPDYPMNDRTSHMAESEAAYEEFCKLYNQSCISYHAALAPPHFAGLKNFSRADIAEDCLHPHKSRLGAAYLGDMLWHWFTASAQARWNVAPRKDRGQTSGARFALPPPVYGARALSLTGNQSWGAQFCYRFDEHMGGYLGRVRDARWESAQCIMDASPPLCGRINPPPPCPVGTQLTSAPKAWAFCLWALVLNGGVITRGKKSPGLVALSPGATLSVLLGAIFDATGTKPASSATIVLTHLASYEHMGIVAYECEGVCACDSQQIDAHRATVNGKRSDSIFESYSIAVRPRPLSTLGAECVLRLQVLTNTSSGGHKFKVRQVSVV